MDPSELLLLPIWFMVLASAGYALIRRLSGHRVRGLWAHVIKSRLVMVLLLQIPLFLALLFWAPVVYTASVRGGEGDLSEKIAKIVSFTEFGYKGTAAADLVAGGVFFLIWFAVHCWLGLIAIRAYFGEAESGL